jgi:hypothetical protein
MITAARADQLEQFGVAAFHPAVHDADRLTPQARRPAVAGLTSQGQRHGILVGSAQPRVAGIAQAA